MFIKANQIVVLADDVVFVRAVRRRVRGKERYAPILQDLLMLEGQKALRRTATRYFQGFVQRRT